jgi:hypothetical protein
MADTKISALTSASTPLAGTEVLPIVQSGATVKVAVSNLTAGRAVSVSTLTATTTIGVGAATPAASGAGITFPASQSASSDANTLDDYEEGTWTPSLGGTTTYNSRSGTYTKVGNIVYAYCLVNVNLIGTGSDTTISGLPFSTVNRSLGSSSYFNTINSSVSFLTPFADGGSTTIKFLGSTIPTPNPTDGISVFKNSAYVILSVVYTV